MATPPSSPPNKRNQPDFVREDQGREKQAKAEEQKKVDTVAQNVFSSSQVKSPPAKENIFASHTITTSNSNPEIEQRNQLVDIVVAKCIKERELKIKALGSGLQTDITNLEKALDIFNLDALQYTQALTVDQTLQSQIIDIEFEIDDIEEDESLTTAEKKQKTEPLEESLEKLKSMSKEASSKLKESRMQLDLSLGQLITGYPHFKLDKAHFSNWYILGRIYKEDREKTLLLFKEQLLNSTVNHLTFVSQALEFATQNKKKIVSEFYKGDTTRIDFNKLSIQVDPVSQETHGEGKVPCKVTFTQEGNKLFQVFLKPRKALLDCSVMELFKEINKLPPSQKSSDILLPEYKILPFPNDDYSIWEFIEGKQFDYHPSRSIGELQNPQKEILSSKLIRLEQICQKIHLSDLHGHNIIFTNLTGNDPGIVPIDLESLQISSTGLYGDQRVPSMKPLTPQEQKAIAKFEESVEKTEFRVVALATGLLEGVLTNPLSFKNITEALMSTCQKQGYTIKKKPVELEELMLRDFLRHDIPYLTQFSKKLYWNASQKGEEIGEKDK